MSTPDETTTTDGITVPANSLISGRLAESGTVTGSVIIGPIKISGNRITVSPDVDADTAAREFIAALTTAGWLSAGETTTPDPDVAFTEAEVEAAARAIRGTAAGHPDDQARLLRYWDNGDTGPIDVKICTRQARAALAALTTVAQSHHDRAVAEAEREVARLRKWEAEVEGLEARNEEAWDKYAEDLERQRDEARAEVARLAGAVERVEGVCLCDQCDQTRPVSTVHTEWVDPIDGANGPVPVTVCTICAALTPATDEREEL